MNKTKVNVIERELEKEKFKLRALAYNSQMSTEQRRAKAAEIADTIRQYERDLAKICR